MKQHISFLRRQCAAVLCSLAAAASVLTLTASADEPYDVYNYNRLGEAVPSQAGYVAERSVSGTDLGAGAFSSPQDLFRSADDCFYIADTGNSRIVKTDGDLTAVLHIYDSFTLPDGTRTRLKNPKGAFVSPDTGRMYIADTDNNRALICEPDGTVFMEITKPDSPVYDKDLTFLPQKILCDSAGNIYIVLSNTTKGAAMFSAEGEFIGYYGANAVARTAKVIADHFWNLIASDEGRRHSNRAAPTAFDNFDIDSEKGFIYTSTSSGASDTDIVKKVNPEGYNLFGYLSDHKWGDLFSAWYSGTTYKTRIVDLDIGEDGSINCLDQTTGRVFQYDKEANLLFILGGTGDQLGTFSSGGNVTAVETRGAGCEEICVLDAGKGAVTVFTQTDFGQTVHTATDLYNRGYYEEALEPWQTVLRQDGNYRRACLGISSAYYNMGRYRDAMKYAKRADASWVYNRAFERYRSEWLRAHLNGILTGCVLLLAAWIVLKQYRKRKHNRQKGGAAA
ncbi:MAG: hypothetical protein J5753_04270 [Oscillospiraceae bacterium]|nr:hypothetical protein [Oscillospiraceae bacterium]